MAISTLQNFYKETVAVDCTTGATNIYVSTKPTPINGYLVISPGSESLREIIKYTGTGTDGTGDYVTIALAGDRGLGGTTDQAHIAGEAVRMNYTAEHQQEIDDTIEAIVAAGAPNASTTVKGISKLSAAPADAAEPIAVGTNDTRMNAGAGMTVDEKDILVAIEAGTFFPAPKVVTFTSSGTWTKDAGLKYITVKLQAAGGGSGEADNGFTCSGAGGGYTEGIIPASDLGDTETVTVGVGGVGGVAGVTPNGQVGGLSSFGSLMIAAGGGGSARNGNSSTGGAVTTPGNIISFVGGKGNNAFNNDNGSTEAAYVMPCSGLGRLSIWTAEVYESGDDRNYTGPSPTGYGFGGAIRGQDSQPTAINGIAGGDGVVIVTEHY